MILKVKANETRKMVRKKQKTKSSSARYVGIQYWRKWAQDPLQVAVMWPALKEHAVPTAHCQLPIMSPRQPGGAVNTLRNRGGGVKQHHRLISIR